MEHQKPFVKVKAVASGNDWSDYISNFKYEDCVDKANMLEIRFSDSYALSVLDSPDFQPKTVLEVQWGYVGGQTSKVHRVTVQDIDAKYGKTVDATIRCLDSTKTINSASVTVLWENKTSSQIATEIGQKYGLLLQVEETSKIWTSIPQTNETDFDFLKGLAKREKSGNFECFVRGSTLYFQKKPVDRKASWVVAYGDEDFLEFTPKKRNSTKKTSDDGVKFVGVDSFNKKVDIEIVDQYNLTDYTALNKGKVAAQPSGGTSTNKMKTSKIDDKTEITAWVFDGKGTQVATDFLIGTSNETTDEKKNLGNSIVKDGKENKNTGNLSIIGNPAWEAGQLVTMKKVAKVHSGNWYIQKVETLIDKSGYKTNCELTRSLADGSKGVVNNSEGTDDTKKKIDRKYDSNGNELGAYSRIKKERLENKGRY